MLIISNMRANVKLIYPSCMEKQERNQSSVLTTHFLRSSCFPVEQPTTQQLKIKDTRKAASVLEAIVPSVVRNLKNKKAGGEELPSGCAVFVRLDNDHLDADRCAQQVDHLLVGESSDSHLADLHQSAALP